MPSAWVCRDNQWLPRQSILSGPQNNILLRGKKVNKSLFCLEWWSVLCRQGAVVVNFINFHPHGVLDVQLQGKLYGAAA